MRGQARGRLSGLGDVSFPRTTRATRAIALALRRPDADAHAGALISPATHERKAIMLGMRKAKRQRMSAPRKASPVVFEGLEGRRMLSAAHDPVYAPHSNVRGESLEQWTADWWTWAFSQPASTSV